MGVDERSANVEMTAAISSKIKSMITIKIKKQTQRTVGLPLPLNLNLNLNHNLPNAWTKDCVTN